MAKPQSPATAHAYLLDAAQRSVLFLDVLRRRGNTHREQEAKAAPHVLVFETELILDGRQMERPVNYLLVRVIPPKGTDVDPAKRPFVVVDPRAGHGPGIGGMKDDSEIGVALKAGHPSYFIGFLPEPVPGQTIEDVWNAQAEFIREVSARHPDASKPAVIANCQAGWQTMIAAATHPDVPGPLLLAGTPLSYWNGVHGQNPLRYLGGMLGGTWLTRLAGDLGAGEFDGANLVSNFEKLDPANTWFNKPYNVYSKVDTEAERFLDFETWWGSPVVVNAQEMTWIADNLFVGNKLTRGDLYTSDGLRIDLRDVKSPIVVFCSWGDNITPPQQALGWITDIYDSDEDLITTGQTIVYSLHDTVGHLGIFVSGKIAAREHDEFCAAMDLVDMLPPGLYEAVIEEVGENTANPELIMGDYLFRLQPRTLDDIRALGGNSPEDERKFAAVDRISAINSRLYDIYLSPFVKAAGTPELAELSRKLHPNRLRFSIFSDENPWMKWVAEAADKVRADRQAVEDENPYSEGEKEVAERIGAALTQFGKARDDITEQVFHLTYGSPLLQALVGIDPADNSDKRKPRREALREKLRSKRRELLERHFDKGGALEAVLRSLAYIRAGEGSIDERGFSMLRQLHQAQPAGSARSIDALKATLRQQYLLLRLDEKRAIATIPQLLAQGAEDRALALQALQQVATATGELSAEGKRRLKEVEALFHEQNQQREDDLVRT